MPEFEYAPAQTIASRIRSDYFPGDEKLVSVPDTEGSDPGSAEADPEDKGELVLDEDGDWQVRTGRDRREAEDSATLRQAREDDDEGDDGEGAAEVSGVPVAPVLKPDWIDRLAMVADRVHRYFEKRRLRRERAQREARREAAKGGASTGSTAPKKKATGQGGKPSGPGKRSKPQGSGSTGKQGNTPPRKAAGKKRPHSGNGNRKTPPRQTKGAPGTAQQPEATGAAGPAKKASRNRNRRRNSSRPRPPSGETGENTDRGAKRSTPSGRPSGSHSREG